MSTRESLEAMRKRIAGQRNAIAVELPNVPKFHVRPIMVDEKDYLNQLRAKGDAIGEWDMLSWLVCEENGERVSQEEREEWRQVFAESSQADNTAVWRLASGEVKPASGEATPGN